MGRGAFAAAGEADAAGAAEAAGSAFFLLAAGKLAGRNPRAATHATAINCDLCFIVLVVHFGIDTDPDALTRSNAFLFNQRSSDLHPKRQHRFSATFKSWNRPTARQGIRSEHARVIGTEDHLD